MAIRKIKISNFKSFKRLDVKLDNFNVLIGANASGKSNFIEIFKFLRDIANFGLENAISNQGGIEYLRNIKIGTSKPLSFEILIDNIFIKTEEINKDEYTGIRAFDIKYEFSLDFKQENIGYKIEKDKLTMRNEYFSAEEKDDEIVQSGKAFKGKSIIIKENGRVDVDLDLPKEFPVTEEAKHISLWKEQMLPVNTLLLETKLPFEGVPPYESVFKGVSIFDINSKLSKTGCPFTGRATLEEDGSNLAIVLNRLLKDKSKQRKFYNLINDILPFVTKIDTEKFVDKSMFFKLTEKFTKNQYLPASVISDGTIKIISLIIAMYFEKKGLTIFEEPERNIHPYLISKLIDMIKDTSKEKEFIVTTHNPELVKHVDIKNILLISRDKEGFSILSKPGEKEEIKTFLKNEIGIEDLYIQNLLEI